MATRTSFRTFSAAALALTFVGARCENPEPGLTPPEDFVDRGVDPRGIRVVETGYENPLIEGHTPLDLNRFTVTRGSTPSPLFGDYVAYRGDTLVNVRVGGTVEPAFLDIARAPIDLRWNIAFAGRRLSLRPEALPVLVRVETVAKSDSFPGGEFITRVDQLRYVLKPDVIVLPVRALVFAAADGSMPYLGGDGSTASGIVSQLLDRAGATGTQLPATGEFSVNAREFEQFATANPDSLWHQCGIQFRLESVEAAPQSQGFERVLVSSTNPCLTFQSPPLAEYFMRVAHRQAIPLFIGGSIRHDLLATDLGITCFSGSTNAFVAVGGSHLLSDGILAHELGHVLLDENHTFGADHLMRPPNPSGNIPGRTVTPEQCALARCKATRLLNRFGLPVPVAAQNACVPFDPVCGNGVRESGEACDDGNVVSGDGCRADCTEERCGDGILDAPAEQCDFGILAQRENCNAACQLCDACNVCGDGVLGPGEQCDDGNTNPKDKCDNQCRHTFG